MKPDYTKIIELFGYFLAWRIHVLTDKKTGIFIGKNIDRAYKIVANYSFKK